MKTTQLILIALAFAAATCKTGRKSAEWEIIPNTQKVDSGFVDGQMQVFVTARVSLNMVCQDSTVQAQKDSAAAKAKKVSK